MTYAIIGGTGFLDNPDFEITDEVQVETPYGSPAAPLLYGKLFGEEAILLRRHGAKHEYAPHRVPYRANIAALKLAQVQGIIAVATVGGIDEQLAAGELAIPDQLIDYTWGREVTFYDDFRVSGVQHVDMTNPFDNGLRNALRQSAKSLDVSLMWGGTYACTQGPRLETAAEIRRFARDGANMVGMTLYPECALAREIALPYAALCVSVNHAAGVASSEKGIDFASLDAMIASGISSAVKLVAGALKRLH